MTQSNDPFAPHYEPPTGPTEMSGIEKPVDLPDRETVEAHLPITISIDVDRLLRSELGWTSYNAGSYEDPEPGYAPGGDGRIVDVVAHKLAKAIEGDVRAAVTEVVKERSLEHIDTLIEMVMNSPIQLTSEYGEPRSPETTMREAMIKAMTDRLEMTVDDSGKPLERSRYSYGDRGFTYLDWRAKKVAQDILDKELSSKLSEASKTIRDKAKNLVSAKIADVLGMGL